MPLTSDEAATLMIGVGATGICVIVLSLVVILWLVVGKIYGLGTGSSNSSGEQSN